MNPISIIGAFIITLSLLSYGMGSITLLRYKKVGSVALVFLSAGLIFDAAAIVLMIIGANGTPFTIHGFIGYIAFLVMLIDIIWVWSVYFRNGIDSPMNKNLQKYSKFAYIYYVLAYLTGSLIVLWR